MRSAEGFNAIVYTIYAAATDETLWLPELERRRALVVSPRRGRSDARGHGTMAWQFIANCYPPPRHDDNATVRAAGLQRVFPRTTSDRDRYRQPYDLHLRPAGSLRSRSCLGGKGLRLVALGSETVDRPHRNRRPSSCGGPLQDHRRISAPALETGVSQDPYQRPGRIGGAFSEVHSPIAGQATTRIFV